MSLANLSISTGNILSGIGNQGVSGEDIAKIVNGAVGGQAAKKAQDEAQAKSDRERRLLIGAGASVGIGLFVVIIFLISQKIKNNA